MYDPTPSPLGDVTRRWTCLTATERDRQVARLLAGGCSRPDPNHVERPDLDGGSCYRVLLPTAAAGDPVALGWLATSHRPLLVARGRALYEHDPTEWGAVCLEILHTVVSRADLSEPCWLRRRVARRLSRTLTRVVARHVGRRAHERPVRPARLATVPVTTDPGWDLHRSDLHVDLTRALASVDPPARDALVALATHRPLRDVADRHGLTHTAIRRRVTRARRKLAPQLAAYRRAA